jgi:hypothetical protein
LNFKALADANDTNKIEHLTWNPPIVLKLNMDADQKRQAYVLDAKVPWNATAFTIDFLLYQNDIDDLTYDNSKCFTDEKGRIIAQ